MNNLQLTTEPVAFKSGRDAEWLSVAAVSSRFSLSKSTVYELIQAREIKSVSLRRTGKQKGKRLVNVDSVRAYFDRLVALTEAPAFVVGKKKGSNK